MPKNLYLAQLQILSDPRHEPLGIHTIANLLTGTQGKKAPNYNQLQLNIARKYQPNHLTDVSLAYWHVLAVQLYHKQYWSTQTKNIYA